MKPILFNTEMVRAIQDWRKTVTRRVLCENKKIHNFRPTKGEWWYNGYGFKSWEDLEYKLKQEAKYKIGDVLYVRETWCKGSLNYGKEKYYYKADNIIPCCTWSPSIHMPKEAARIFLRVTGVRVERLQDMTEDDAYLEGFSGFAPCEHTEYYDDYAEECYNTDYCAKCHYINMSVPEMFGEIVWDSTIKKSDLDKYGWRLTRGYM